MASYTEQEKERFLEEWGEHFKSEMKNRGVLPLQSMATLKLYPEGVELLEKKYRFRPTGDIETFLSNYRRTYYTPQCVANSLRPRECLVQAARLGHLDVINYAIEKYSGDPEMNVIFYFEALENAAGFGHMDIVDRLLREVGSNTKSYNTILRGAAKGGRNNIIQLMIQKGAKNLNEGLYVAAYNGHLDTVKFLVDNKATDLGGALEEAAKSGRYDVAEFLLEQGADNLESSAHWAKTFDYLEIVALIRHYQQ